MAYDLKAGVVGLRAEVVDAAVKQVAARTYKFKQACAEVSTNAWKNTFFREQLTIPTGGTGNAIKGIPRGANFPQYSIGWDEVSVRITKFGLEENIAWEDLLSDEINVQARTIIRITEGVVKAVDDHIWDVLVESLTPSLIQTFGVQTAAHGHWDVTSAAIIDDLMHASRLIAESNYDVSDLMAFISPYDKQNIMRYLTDKGAQFPSIATDVANNGRIGRLAGITLVESNSVTASYALVLKPKTCATIKQLVPLTTNVTEDPLKSWRLRIAEELTVELTDPKAVVLLTNTKSP